MAFEKAKVIKAAEKFLSQGKINAAIKEYRQIIKHDPDDLTTLNMLGDLLARAGEKEEAASCFQRIAEHYREREFQLKAIAMYRKVDKLKPRDPAIARELADLYAAQGLIADARSQYLVVAESCTRNGQSKQALKVLHTIADLDPHNTDVRLKLAESYLKEQMPAEAAKAYTEAANRLLENSRVEQSLQAFTKALELRPGDRAALKGVVSAHVAAGTADEAAELLEARVAASPDDVELISMLAGAYVEAEDAEGAERATAMLMAQDASNYRRYIEVSRLYLKLGKQDEAARILGLIIESMLAGREENDLLDLVNELLARDPEHVPSLRLLTRIHWWQRDMEKLRAVLERLAEAAEALALPDDERYALTQLVRLAPEETRYVERLQALGGSLEEHDDAGRITHSQAPLAPSFEMSESSKGATDGSEQSLAFEWNSVAQETPAAGVSFADLNEPEEVPAAETAEFADPFATPLEPAAEQSGSQATPNVEAMMSQELESVDFYIAQHYYDIASDTLGLVERQFGSHPEIEARRAQIRAARKPGPAAFDVVAEPAAPDQSVGTEITFGEVDLESAVSTPPVSAPPQRAIDSGLAEIFEEFRLEAEGDSESSAEDYETHYNMATAYKEMDLLDEAIREFQLAAGLTSPTEGTPRYFQCCNMLGHCFAQKGLPQAAVLWFKKGLDVVGRGAEETKALQYELGSAYEQMGDVSNAVAAFTEVYGVDVAYRDTSKRLSSLQTRLKQGKKSK